MSNNPLYVFKISFKNTYQIISNNDLERIANLDIESSFDYKKDDFFYFYVITSKIEIKKYLKILDKNLINYTFDDISDLVIKDQYDFSYLEEFVTDENSFIYEIFIDDLNRWIYSKLDLDTVLDIISLKGINSLRKVDRKFLKDNYETH
jgi:hypothetical protein